MRPSSRPLLLVSASQVSINPLQVSIHPLLLSRVCLSTFLPRRHFVMRMPLTRRAAREASRRVLLVVGAVQPVHPQAPALDRSGGAGQVHTEVSGPTKGGGRGCCICIVRLPA
jgi:hypothetical protein